MPGCEFRMPGISAPQIRKKAPRTIPGRNASVTISRVLYWTVIYPGHTSPYGSSDCGERGGPPTCLPCILRRAGFTSRTSCQAAGELLPRLSILTAPKNGGLFLLHFPWSRLHRPLTGALALWRPDFPHASRHATVCSPRAEDILPRTSGFCQS